MTLQLTGRVALVTGGSDAVGAAAALALSEARARVAICSTAVAELQKTAAEIEEKTGHRVVAIPAEVSSAADVERLMREVQDLLGGVDILVNAAGSVGQTGPFEEISTELYAQLYELNVVPMVRLVKAVLPAMKAKRWGRIINVSSENGLQPDPDMTPYNLTQAAIINFSKSLSKSVSGYNILVNTISTLSKDIAAKSAGAAIAFLASEQASFITGTNLRVDGGSVASI